MKRNITPQFALPLSVLPLTLLALLALAPAASATVPYVSSLETYYQLNATLLLIPAIVLEAAVAYFVIKKFLGFAISPKLALVAFAAANIVSALIGLAIAGLLPTVLWNALQEGSYTLLDSMLILIPMYLITSLVELPVVYLFIRNKTKTALVPAAKVSFLVNIVGYALIPLFMLALALELYLRVM